MSTPTVTESWQAYRSWLERHVPLAHENLAPPATEQQLAEVERVTGQELPEALKALWRMNNGQKRTMHASSSGHAVVCIPTLSFLSTDLALEVWRMWDDLRREDAGLEELQSAGSSLEEGVTQPLYTHAGWLPLWSDPVRSDYIGVDLAPGERGQVGQIINFGRDEEAHYSPARSLEELLSILLTEVESGRWQASQLDQKSTERPWFGSPDAHFFNTLYKYWRKRMPRSANDALSDATEAAEAEKHERVLELVEEARTLGKEHGKLFELRAEALEALERYEEAEVAWKRACELHPKKGYGHSRALNQAYNLERYADAEATLREELKLFPRSTRCWHLLAQLVGYHQRRFAESLPLWDSACECPTSGPDDYGNAAYAFAAAGKLTEAVHRAKQALEDGAEDDASAVEQYFYLYAIGDAAERPHHLRKLRALLDAGVRTSDWDLAPIIKAASTIGHPEHAWLAPLARVVNEVESTDSLSAWQVWIDAGA